MFPNLLRCSLKLLLQCHQPCNDATMKIDSIKSLIAIAISVLLAYACYEICEFERVQWVVTIGAFLTIVLPTLLAIGVTVKAERSAIVLSILSWVMLLIEIGINGVFVFFDFSIPVYIIVNGIVLLIYILVYNSICKQRM